MDPKAAPRSWEAWQVLAAALVVVVVVGVPVVMSLNRKPLPPDEYSQAVVLGNPLRLETGAGGRVYLLAEQKRRYWYWYSGGRSSFNARQVSREEWNVDLWALDATDGRVLWRRRFEDNPTGVMTRHSQLLTAEGDVLRVDLSEPLRVSAQDGATLPMPAGEVLPLAGTEVNDAYGTVTRGLLDEAGTRWLGLLAAADVTRLADAKWTPENLASVPFAEEAHLFHADVKRVSAAPADWPAGLGGNWGERNRYARYRTLQPAPAFRQAGLLVAVAQGPAIRLADPEGVLVLHRPDGDPDGALQLARIEAESGRALWDTALPQRRLRHVMPGTHVLILGGTGPHIAGDAAGDPLPPPYWFSFIDLASGQRRDVELGMAGQVPPTPEP